MLSTEHQRDIRARQGDVCFYCGCAFGPGRKAPIYDHFIPRSRGGAHDQSNRVAACSPCDGAKRDRMPTEAEIRKFETTHYGVRY